MGLSMLFFGGGMHGSKLWFSSFGSLDWGLFVSWGLRYRLFWFGYWGEVHG